MGEISFVNANRKKIASAEIQRWTCPESRGNCAFGQEKTRRGPGFRPGTRRVHGSRVVGSYAISASWARKIPMTMDVSMSNFLEHWEKCVWGESCVLALHLAGLVQEQMQGKYSGLRPDTSFS